MVQCTTLQRKVLFYVRIQLKLWGFFAILRENSRKRLYGVLAILRGHMWLFHYRYLVKIQ